MKNRRAFLADASGYGAGVFWMKSAGIITMSLSSSKAFSQAGEGWHDTYIRFAGKPDDDTITITAAMLKAGEAVSLNWTDTAGTPHVHSLDITPAMIASINSGQVANGVTGLTNDHTHNFTIDPAAKVPGGDFIPADSTSGEGEEGDGTLVSNAQGELSMILGVGQTPHVFIEVTSPNIDLNSLTFCVAKSTDDQCSAGVQFIPIQNNDGRKVYGSASKLNLVDQDILKLIGKDTSGNEKILAARVTQTSAGFALK